MRRWHKALWLLLTLIVAVAAAQQPESSPGPSAWRIAGKVVDAHSGQPLTRCTVAIRLTTSPSPATSMLTGEDGQFLFQNLDIGKYELTAARRGYLTQSYEGHENFSTAIAVGPHLKSEGLTFKVMPQAMFFGTVTDETGEPVRRAQVRLYRDQKSEGLRATQPLAQAAVTDDRGVYEISNVSPANYFLAVSAQPWYSRAAMGMYFRSGKAETRDSINNVAFATTYYPNATDTDEATPIPIRGGDRIEANMTLTAQPSVPIRITLPPGDQSGYGAIVSKLVFGQPEQLGFPAMPGPDGVIEINGALSGHYEVMLTHSVDGISQPATHLTAEVTGGNAEVSDEKADDEIVVTGKVIAGENVVHSGSMLLVATRPRRYYQENLNKDGEFTFRLPAGEYEVVGQLPRMYLARVSSPNAVVKGRMLQVKPGSAPVLEITAGSGFGRLDGVVERAGKPASGAMVVLAPEDAGDNRILFRRDQTDSDGTFSLFNVVPGKYRLLAIDDAWDLEWANPALLGAFLKKSIPVEVRPTERLKQTVELQLRSEGLAPQK
jgi:Carboxypeptidase regulatory-like domain